MRLVLLGVFSLLLSSCAKEFLNPYDPATPPYSWMPRDLVLDTLDNNSVRLSWQQDELHIDGYTVRRDVSGQVSEFTIPFDSLTFSDIMVVDSAVTDTCPAVLYSVMARAGENRSDVLTSAPVVFPIPTEADAGADQNFTDNTTQIMLSANSPVVGETGQWSVVSGNGGSFTDASSPTTTFTGQSCSSYVLRWRISGSCGNESMDEVSVSFQQQTTQANAGADQNFTDNTTQATLSANSSGIGETGQWSVVSGNGGSFSDASSPTTTFSGQPCTSYVLRWTISGSCGTSRSDELAIHFQQQTTQADAGADITAQEFTVQMNANSPNANESGNWTIISGSGGTISDPSSGNSTFTGIPEQVYLLTWIISGQCYNTLDTLQITFPLIYYTIDESISDLNGNVYPTILLGNGQRWMKEDLKTSYYSNGDSIQNAINHWNSFQEGVFCSNGYRTFYNGYAVIDPRGICPMGWRVPTAQDWADLAQFLGGWQEAGIKLKQQNCWSNAFNPGTNESGFSACAYGYYKESVSSSCLSQDNGVRSEFWSNSMVFNPPGIDVVGTSLNSNELYQVSDGLQDGHCVRCIKDQ